MKRFENVLCLLGGCVCGGGVGVCVCVCVCVRVMKRAAIFVSVESDESVPL